MHRLLELLAVPPLRNSDIRFNCSVLYVSVCGDSKR